MSMSIKSIIYMLFIKLRKALREFRILRDDIFSSIKVESLGIPNSSLNMFFWGIKFTYSKVMLNKYKDVLFHQADLWNSPSKEVHRPKL